MLRRLSDSIDVALGLPTSLPDTKFHSSKLTLSATGRFLLHPINSLSQQQAAVFMTSNPAQLPLWTSQATAGA